MLDQPHITVSAESTIILRGGGLQLFFLRYFSVFPYKYYVEIEGSRCVRCALCGGGDGGGMVGWRVTLRTSDLWLTISLLRDSHLLVSPPAAIN